eukprot:3881659-Amphidinium_carterae.1
MSAIQEAPNQDVRVSVHGVEHKRGSRDSPALNSTISRPVKDRCLVACMGNLLENRTEHAILQSGLQCTKADQRVRAAGC